MRSFRRTIKFVALLIVICVVFSVLSCVHARFYYDYPRPAYGTSTSSLLTNSLIVTMSAQNMYWKPGYEERLVLFPAPKLAKGQAEFEWFPSRLDYTWQNSNEARLDVDFNVVDSGTTFAVVKTSRTANNQTPSDTPFGYQGWVNDGKQWYYASYPSPAFTKKMALKQIEEGSKELARRQTPNWKPLPTPTPIPVP